MTRQIDIKIFDDFKHLSISSLKKGYFFRKLPVLPLLQTQKIKDDSILIIVMSFLYFGVVLRIHLFFNCNFIFSRDAS